jgi:hypothetical protein
VQPVGPRGGIRHHDHGRPLEVGCETWRAAATLGDERCGESESGQHSIKFDLMTQGCGAPRVDVDVAASNEPAQHLACRSPNRRAARVDYRAEPRRRPSPRSCHRPPLRLLHGAPLLSGIAAAGPGAVADPIQLHIPHRQVGGLVCRFLGGIVWYSFRPSTHWPAVAENVPLLERVGGFLHLVALVTTEERDVARALANE